MSVESPFTPKAAFRPIQPSPIPLSPSSSTCSTPTSDIIDIPERDSDDEYKGFLDYVTSTLKISSPKLDSFIKSINIQTEAYNRIKTNENNPQPPVLYKDTWVPNVSWSQLIEIEYNNLHELKREAVKIMKDLIPISSPKFFNFV